MPRDTPVVAPADRRFRRAKVKPVRKRRALIRAWHVLRTVSLIVAIAYACYRGTALITTAPALQIDRIVVHGNERLSTGEILGVLDGLRGSSIIRARLGLWRQRLLTSSWVRDAALRRVLPSTIEVAISERSPVGVARLGSSLYLMDGDGTIIDEYGAQYVQFDLPIIDGLAVVPRRGPVIIDQTRAALAARLLDAVRPDPDLFRRVSQIDVRDLHNAIVLLEDDPALIHLGEDQFLERLKSYADLAAALRDRIPKIDYVDLRFGERVYVRPAAQAVGPEGRPAPAATIEGRRRF